MPILLEAAVMAETETTTKIRRPAPGSKAEAILTLTTTTPATPTEIAETVSSPRQYVHDVLNRYGIEPNTQESFKTYRADIFAAIQQKFIECADDPAIKKMIERRGLTDLGILYDKERIERGLSDSTSKPLVMIQINAPGGTDVKAVTVDSPVDK